MTLSNESTKLLADTISERVFEIVSSDGRYLDGVMNSIEPAIIEVIGKCEPDVIAELSCLIMENIGVSDNSIWKKRYEALYHYVKYNFASEYVDGAEYGTSHVVADCDI